MRALLLLLLVLAAPAAAQGVLDTTDWRSYFPLEVGNRWQYFVEYFDPPGAGHFGYEVVRDTLIEGRLYYAIRTCYEGGSGVPATCSDVSTINPFFEVRYDTTHSYVAEHIVVGGVPDDIWWDPVPCALDAPFGAPVECTGPLAEGTRYFVSGGLGYNLVLPPDTVGGVVYKQFDSIPVIMGAVAGFGVVSRYYIKSAPRYEALVYARVGGEEYGTAAFAFPTAAEPEPHSEAFSLRVWPNPARGRATVAFTLQAPSTARLAVYDGLGRAVLARELGTLPAGRHEMALDLSALAPGLYVVRVTAGEATGVVRFTRTAPRN
jgi:hypothetical protein